MLRYYLWGETFETWESMGLFHYFSDAVAAVQKNMATGMHYDKFTVETWDVDSCVLVDTVTIEA